jgi:hypothetical protein
MNCQGEELRAVDGDDDGIGFLYAFACVPVQNEDYQ